MQDCQFCTEDVEQSRLKIGIEWSMRELPTISYVQEKIVQRPTIWEDAHMTCKIQV